MNRRRPIRVINGTKAVCKMYTDLLSSGYFQLLDIGASPKGRRIGISCHFCLTLCHDDVIRGRTFQKANGKRWKGDEDASGDNFGSFLKNAD